MSTSQRAIDRGRERGRRVRLELGREIRDARRAAGLSQKVIARATGIHPSTLGRIDRAELGHVSLERYAELLALVGLELAARGYPAGPPIRDAGHVVLLTRCRARVGDAWRWLTEVPVGGPGDLRAWDAVIVRRTVRIGIEAETRLGDVQALLRRIELKCRDSGIGRVLIIASDTRANRAAVVAAAALLGGSFFVSPSVTWAALRAGRDPGGNAVLLV